jgi:hypothetical protein
MTKVSNKLSLKSQNGARKRRLSKRSQRLLGATAVLGTGAALSIIGRSMYKEYHSLDNKIKRLILDLIKETINDMEGYDDTKKKTVIHTLSNELKENEEFRVLMEVIASKYDPEGEYNISLKKSQLYKIMYDKKLFDDLPATNGHDFQIFYDKYNEKSKHKTKLLKEYLLERKKAKEEEEAATSAAAAATSAAAAAPAAKVAAADGSPPPAPKESYKKLAAKKERTSELYDVLLHGGNKKKSIKKNKTQTKK